MAFPSHAGLGALSTERHSPNAFGGARALRLCGMAAGLHNVLGLLQVNPNHVIFQELGDFPIACAIPYFIHGDEGRGYCRRPFMVESWQPVISYKGLDKINESGYLGLCCSQLSVN